MGIHHHYGYLCLFGLALGKKERLERPSEGGQGGTGVPLQSPAAIAGPRATAWGTSCALPLKNPLGLSKQHFWRAIMVYRSTSFGLVALLERTDPVLGSEGMGGLCGQHMALRVGNKGSLVRKMACGCWRCILWSHITL